MNTEILGVALQILLLLVISYPLGKHIAKVYKEGNDCMRFMAPIERFIYKLAGINPNEEMDWKAFLKSLLIINVFWFFWGMILLVSQGYLPLNPDGNSGQSPDLAFNTCISFMVNCNLQHYSGESGLTYFTQLFVIMLFQFITAATGMAAMAGIMKSMAAKTTKTIGNFWHYLVISCTRILFPMSLIVGFILIIQGTPMGFDSKMTIPTLEGAEQTVSQGPTAAIVPIKQLGTNGGGYFGVNSSHPLENPTYLTNIIECWSILIIPMALVFALGFYLKRKKLGYVIYGVMLFAYLLGVFCNVHYEMAGNPKIDEMGIDQSCGAMEGKETRLGPGATALWSVTTTVTSNGSVNGMHDSTMPLSGMVEMLNMQINTWFGGVGVGFMNYYAFLIIAVFISGLMVGRTPEFLGKKVEAREMKIATIVSLAHPFVILIFTAISSYVWVYCPGFVESEGGWLNNPGFHGFSEMLYEYTSSSANNGSGFEGLGDNTYFWNYTCGLALIISRYLPIVGQVAIAGLLANKKYAGLRDAYLYAHSDLARQMLIDLTDWMIDITSGLSDNQMQDMLRSEHGGLNETFADVAEITGDKKYLKLARRFSHKVILDPLIKNEDRLNGMHANTQIPKVIGYKRVAEVSKNDKDWNHAAEWDHAARFFWNTVVNHRSVCIGGNSVREHFHPSDNFTSMLNDVQGPETCNTYNMLRLTKMLYQNSRSEERRVGKECRSRWSPYH